MNRRRKDGIYGTVAKIGFILLIPSVIILLIGYFLFPDYAILVPGLGVENRGEMFPLNPILVVGWTIFCIAVIFIFLPFVQMLSGGPV